LNPATPLSSIEAIIKDVDLVLVMSVNPGFGGQHFISGTLDKIAQARLLIDKHKSTALLEVDGGITVDNAAHVVGAGADILVSGSAIFTSPDYGATITALRQAGRAGRRTPKQTRATSARHS
jgi:ribulose-phosphate 3-epimerase